MSTVIRPEVSEKNEYWISRHRYYELKHFCLQYPEWKKIYRTLQMDCIPKCVSMREVRVQGIESKTERLAILLNKYRERIEMIEKASEDADPELGNYILLAVTEGYPYTKMQTQYDIPCCRDTYYDRYRKFFWILNNERE